jgi:hypothetical protein
MHGTTEGRDHNSLAFMRPEALDMVVESLRREPGEPKVFTLEIFSEADFLSSCETLERYRI